MNEARRTAAILCPGHPRTRGGNRVTALRWAKILRELSWSVRVADEWRGQRVALVIALHALRSHASIVRLCAEPRRPRLVVALTGTDVYGEGDGEALDDAALDALSRADRIVALQELAAARLPAELAAKTQVIHQSVPRPACRVSRREDRFEIVLLANVRAVKDPLLAALATRELPASSRAHVLHCGEILDEELGRRVAEESRSNARYEWLGPLPRSRALELLAGASLCVSTSRAEGGPNAISEALALDVPVLATAIPGHVGLLGDRYPGLFEAGDSRELARLLARAETEPSFLTALAEACRARAWIVERPRERSAWRQLIAELFVEREPNVP